jgi:hypothetical protein
MPEKLDMLSEEFLKTKSGVELEILSNRSKTKKGRLAPGPLMLISTYVFDRHFTTSIFCGV